MSKKTKDPYRLTALKQIGWSGRAVSIASNVVILGYLTYYCTNILGMSAVLVGSIFLASKIFDGVTDLVAGMLIDNTNTRWGKARPYEFSIIGVWIATIAVFACPDLGTTGEAAWLFVMYSLINAVFTTLLNASETIYMIRAFKYEDDRNKVISVNGLIVTLGATVISIIFPILMGTMGTTKEGWLKMILIFAIPLTIIGMARFLFVPEVNDEVVTNTTEKISVKDFIPALKDKYLWMVLAISLLVCLISNTNTAVGTYYFTYIVGDIAKMSLVSMLGLFIPLSLLIMPKLLGKIGVKNLFVYSFIGGAIGCAIKGVAGANMPLIMIGTVIQTFAGLTPSYFTMLLIISVMDYHEWKTGKRVEGVISAINSFSGKVAGGLASGGMGLIMGIAGFEGTAEVITASARTSIVVLYTWLPAVLYIVLVLLMRKWDLEEKMPQIHEELAKRHQEGKGV